MYRYIPKKTLNIDLFHVKKKKYLYPIFLLQLHLVASYFIQNILHVTWPLSWTMQCFICATHLHCFRLITKIMSEVTHSSHTDERLWRQNCSTMSETCRWQETEATLALHYSTYLIKQRLPLLRQGKRKNKRASERESERIKEVDTKKILRNRCQSERGAPVWKWWILAKRTHSAQHLP